LKVVARFDPPNAHAAVREWREQHAAALSALPDEAIKSRSDERSVVSSRRSRSPTGTPIASQAT